MKFVVNKFTMFSRGVTLGCLLGVSFSAHAFEFVSVATPSILYDAPSLQAKKLYVAARYLPLELVVPLDSWVKVRDSAGELFWIEKSALSNQHYVMVNVPVAAVRANPDENAAIIYQAPQQLALEWVADSGNGWLQVRHQDGTTGYIKLAEVWGD